MGYTFETDRFFVLKKECESNKSLSVCLRGINIINFRYDFVKFKYNPTDRLDSCAKVKGFIHIRFSDLKEKHYRDNYDINARTYETLYATMLDYYHDFDENELVTIVKFTTHSLEEC